MHIPRPGCRRVARRLLVRKREEKIKEEDWQPEEETGEKREKRRAAYLSVYASPSSSFFPLLLSPHSATLSSRGLKMRSRKEWTCFLVSGGRHFEKNTRRREREGPPSLFFPSLDRLQTQDISVLLPSSPIPHYEVTLSCARATRATGYAPYRPLQTDQRKQAHTAQICLSVWTSVRSDQLRVHALGPFD